MHQRNIKILRVLQLQGVTTTTPGVDVDLLVNPVLVDNGARQVRVAIKLDGTFTRATKKKPVHLTVSLTRKDPTNAIVEAGKRHRKGELLHTEKRRIPIGFPAAPTSADYDVREIRIPKDVFEDPDTVFVIHVRSGDRLAICTRNIYTA